MSRLYQKMMVIPEDVYKEMKNASEKNVKFMESIAGVDGTVNNIKLGENSRVMIRPDGSLTTGVIQRRNNKSKKPPEKPAEGLETPSSSSRGETQVKRRNVPVIPLDDSPVAAPGFDLPVRQSSQGENEDLFDGLDGSPVARDSGAADRPRDRGYIPFVPQPRGSDLNMSMTDLGLNPDAGTNSPARALRVSQPRLAQREFGIQVEPSQREMGVQAEPGQRDMGIQVEPMQRTVKIQLKRGPDLKDANTQYDLQSAASTDDEAGEDSMPPQVSALQVMGPGSFGTPGRGPQQQQQQQQRFDFENLRRARSLDARPLFPFDVETAIQSLVNRRIVGINNGAANNIGAPTQIRAIEQPEPLLAIEYNPESAGKRKREDTGTPAMRKTKRRYMKGEKRKRDTDDESELDQLVKRKASAISTRTRTGSLPARVVRLTIPDSPERMRDMTKKGKRTLTITKKKPTIAFVRKGKEPGKEKKMKGRKKKAEKDDDDDEVFYPGPVPSTSTAGVRTRSRVLT